MDLPQKWVSKAPLAETLSTVKPFTYIPPPTPAEYQQLVNKIAAEGPALRPDQHVASRVVLDRFAEPVDAKGVRKVRILSREYPMAKYTQLGPAGCGKFRHLMRFASKSSEDIWAETETLLRKAADAADAGTFYDDPHHAEVVRKAIVLHFVRSIPSLILSDQTWRNRHAAYVERWLGDGRDLLSRLHRARFGWTANNDDQLRVMAEELIAPVAAQMDKGIYFRVTVVERYHRFCEMLRDQPVELRRVPNGELLIGDVPALAMSEGEPGSGPLDGPGLADCDELVLPLGPHLLAVLGAGHGYTDLARNDVDRFNAAQVRAAADHVFMRPGSGLEQFVRSTDSTQRPNRIPAHLRQSRNPRRLWTPS